MTEQIRTGEPIIIAEGLRKRYESNIAVDGIDLTVYAGEIFGILGPNGAGKTTTLEMMEGLRKPDQGSIQLAGFDAVTQIDKVRPLIGAQLQTTALFDYLTAGELIELFASLYHAPEPRVRGVKLLGMAGLLEKRDSRVHQLSGGQQQRLSIALALVNDPLVAFLDEPTTGLDPGARRNLWQTIRDIRDSGTTVVLTTHYMEEAETLCDRVAVMDYGRVIALDTPRALIRGLNAAATINATTQNGAIALARLETLPAVITASTQDSHLGLSTTDAQATMIGLLDLATRLNIRLADLRSSQATLEDVFLSLTGREYEPQDGEPEPAETSEPRQSRRFGRG
ncbi:ABC transporter ATP-binding protein [soil metagenome]